MLTRPGSEPGPERMRKLAGSPEGFRQIRKSDIGDRRSFRYVTGCLDFRRGLRSFIARMAGTSSGRRCCSREAPRTGLSPTAALP